MADNLRVVIAAAGRGRRMEDQINKQYILLGSRPVLAYSLEFFENIDKVDRIVVVARKKEIEYCRREVVERYGFKKVSHIVAGGKERQNSVWAGLQQLGRDTDYVAVHDGARPLLSSKVLYDLLRTAEEWGAAIPGVAGKDTLKMVDRDGFVRQTMDRESIYSIQTPQVFKYAELLHAYQQANEEGFIGTDDASLFEHFIGRVKVVKGDERNIKITTQDDLILTHALLQAYGLLHTE
ncbi:MAG TPA: 2-C-methyl-D-erythritol 4-phosphate cytidylyltransferase [Syntrophomonadaceae bacterium]|jgi:2-C-methyl-D-erythritol 4-phosphate cytidylyltransferase|nr:2-C-methyl-D-erythritol 4-phosphate cytidylyltransferase [Syntrophomonadaceae bacterium]